MWCTAKETPMLFKAYHRVKDRIQYYLDYFYWRKKIKQNMPDIDDFWLKHSAEFHAQYCDRFATMKPKYTRQTADKDYQIIKKDLDSK